ncbi:MAG TPA: tetratricopeptide repeat protein [Methylococcaceae bacterium]|nr:tetratricopeptide repeat protein [Methylococcaceae bacterium]
MPDTSPPNPEIDPPTSSVASISGGVNMDAERDIVVGGDVVGRDKITHTEQIDTGGGAYVGESMEVGDHGTFAGRDIRTVNVSGSVNAPIVLGDVYGEVHLYAAAPIEIPAPPPLPSLPTIVQFIGREAELASYTKQLIEQRWIVISGMAGTGKTALAIELARRISAPDKIFWHTFHEPQGIQVVIWQLAGFLGRRGLEDLWQMLQLARQTGGQLPPTETLFDYLIQLVQDQDVLLCFDDMQLVSDDPLLEQLFTRLRHALTTGRFKLIIVSQSLLDFASTFEFEPLAGLNLEDTRQLLIARELALPDALVTRLHFYTDGNAQFLTLAIEILRRANDPEQVIERLAEVSNIERYLVAEVYQRLTADERAVMSAVAVLLGYPAASGAIEAILDGGSIRLSLRDLCNRYLLISSEGVANREYSQHAMVQAFFYELLGQRDRKVMHQRAGRYYETDELDLLKAAIHFQRAGEHAKAARLATTDVWGSINLGQLLVLQDLLEHFSAQELEAVLWVKVNLARGQVYAVRGMSERARDSYQQGYSLLATLSDSLEIRGLKARACRGMGELLEYESPLEALDWLQRGLAELPEDSRQEESALHIHIGIVHINLGSYADAKSALEHSLDLLPISPSQLRGTTLTNLGGIYFYHEGNVQNAIECALKALEISHQLHDHFQSATILSNLGIYKFTEGNWADAIADFQQAYTFAEHLGSQTIKAAAEGNIGIAYTNMGNDQTALKHLGDSLAVAHQSNLHLLEGIAQFHLSDLHIRRGEWEAAKQSLQEAERIAQETDTQALLPEIYGARAEIELAAGHNRVALEWANQSVKLAQEIGESAELGISLRVLGQAASANGEPQKAMTAFEQSLALLENHDRYEAGRTRLHWGIALLSNEDAMRSRTLLQEARLTFANLGALRDLEMVDRFLRPQ